MNAFWATQPNGTTKLSDIKTLKLKKREKRANNKRGKRGGRSDTYQNNYKTGDRWK